MSPIHYLLALLAVWAVCVAIFGRAGVKAASVATVSPSAPAAGSLAAAMHSTDNFLLLRLFAASFVVWYHSYALAGAMRGPDPVSTVVGIHAGLLAVYIFFAISGFLVTGSWLRRRSLPRFLLARLFRIAPGLLFCVTLCAFALGALMTSLPLRDYLAHPDTASYVWRNLLFAADKLQYELPGVFDGRGVNGSLWTIPAEMAMYAWLALAGALGLLGRPRSALLALLAWGVAAAWLGPAAVLLPIPEYLPMAACFWLGALAWIHRDRLPLRGWIVIALLLLCVVAKGSVVYLPCVLVTLVYTTLWVAYVPRLPARWSQGAGDYSYGIYLWGAPLQQSVVATLDSVTPTQLTLIAWPLAFAMAVVSWHCVEQPAIRLLQRRLATRGVAKDIASVSPAVLSVAPLDPPVGNRRIDA